MVWKRKPFTHAFSKEKLNLRRLNSGQCSMLNCFTGYGRSMTGIVFVITAKRIKQSLTESLLIWKMINLLKKMKNLSTLQAYFPAAGLQKTGSRISSTYEKIQTPVISHRCLFRQTLRGRECVGWDTILLMERIIF